eukprot:m.114543 g.114543  ORF g.114543 m.114543 type:complete len:118 (-) comp12822_c3_seq2:787-1140(-)
MVSGSFVDGNGDPLGVKRPATLGLGSFHTTTQTWVDGGYSPMATQEKLVVGVLGLHTDITSIQVCGTCNYGARMAKKCYIDYFSIKTDPSTTTATTEQPSLCSISLSWLSSCIISIR